MASADALLGSSACRTQMYLSKQMAQLRPEVTMPMFSGKLNWLHGKLCQAWILCMVHVAQSEQ